MTSRSGTRHRINIATDPTLNTQAQVLGARIEAELGKPAVVMVTSASAGDGKSLTAYSLAASLEKNNHRVTVIEIPNEGGNSHERLSAFVEKMRSNYDFAIIDAATFGQSSSVMSLAGLVDGILLTVRFGRAPIDVDASMVGMLEQCSGNIVGVVATEAEAIANFERAREESSAFPRPLIPVAAERVLR
jgi:Mrp family chromosome partitioning ATPase